MGTSPASGESGCRHPQPEKSTAPCNAAIASDGLCLAHLHPDQQSAYLATLTPGADLDLRGVTLTAELLARLLAALSVPDQAGPRIGNADFRRTTFEGHARFLAVSFAGDADFRHATFGGIAGFDRATFSGPADFRGVTFTNDASFQKATFTKKADFSGADFLGGTDWLGGAHFTGATFADTAYFAHASIKGDALFARVTFGLVFFSNVIFSRGAIFQNTAFNEDAFFARVTFTWAPEFQEATFAGATFFRDTTFTHGANFRGAEFKGTKLHDAEYMYETDRANAFDNDFADVTFTQSPCFGGVAFQGDTSFRGATFTEGADFSKVSFNETVVFSGATFLGNTELTGRAQVLDLTDVQVGGRLAAETAGRQINGRGLKGSGRVTLRVRAAAVDLSDAVCTGRRARPH
jgi:uncharacterized protein YjbI with pentapeptide repeats